MQEAAFQTVAKEEEAAAAAASEATRPGNAARCRASW